MARAERPRGKCSVCGKDCAITDEGGARHHFTEDPDKQAGPDSRKCKGVGQPPAGAQPTRADGLRFLCRVPSGPGGCGHQVQLTANHRARTHLTPAGGPCAEGSSAPPIAVGPDGYRADTADWTEEDWSRALPLPEPRGEVLPAARVEDLRFGSENAVEDFLGTGGAPADPHAREADSALEQAEVQRLQDVFARDADNPTITPRDDAPVFDETHDFSDDVTQTYGVHPGPAEECTLPECCTHPQGFQYVDDDNGHSGEFCPLCGAEPPEPCRHEYVAWDDLDDDGTECTVWACKHCGELEPWRTPADLLALMPADVQKLAAEGPRCWDCGHPVTPLADRFEADGSVLHVVWICAADCMAHETGDHYSSPCRPQSAAQCTVGELEEGVLFRRHTLPEPVGSLVYRAGAPAMGPLSATVVTAGPYGGRTGSLTNLTEEVTCTDLDGAPRPRRASDPAAQRPTRRPQPPSSNGPQGSPARSSRPTTKETAPAATSTTSSPGTASGPTDSTGTSTRTAPVTTEAQAAGDFLAAGSGSYGEAEAKYGRWGRYKLTHPATGQTVEWTRATTFAKSISDTFTLSQWGNRNVLLGATLKPDVVAAAHGKDVSRDREQLNTWCEELQQAAGSKVAANLGTAVHSFTEAVDRRWAERWEAFKEVPDEFKPHVKAYILLLEEHGLEPVPHMIEFSTGVLQYEVMGTSDNCYRATRHLVLKMPRGEVRLSPGEHVIGDKKTGKDLDYGWQEICIQLALYVQGVNTQGIYNWADDTWDTDPLARYAEPGTKVREDVGVILHLPVDPRSKKHPALYGVDLASGWNAAVLCERVRTWRKLRNLAGPVAVVDEDPLAEGSASAPAPRAAVRPPTLRERAEAVTSNTEASQVYQDAQAAGVSVAEAKELIAVMQAAIAKVAEPGGAKV